MEMMSKDIVLDCYSLWESCFGDTKAYMEFYFQNKVGKNEIFVMEEDGNVVSMVHLNPYVLQVNEKEWLAHYIVGVATNPEYRRRGYMGQLLREAMEFMYDKGEAFSYLMPAAYEIYAPYDFRYIYEQRRLKMQMELQDKSVMVPFVECKPYSKCSDREKERLLSFVNDSLQKAFQVFAVRSEEYYERLAKEMKACGGDLLLLSSEEQIIGVVPYSVEEETLCFPELLIQPSYTKAILATMVDYVKNSQAVFHTITSLESYFVEIKQVEELFKEVVEEQKPIIMARIIHAKQALALLRATKPLSLVIKVNDKFLERNEGTYEIRVWESGCEVIETTKEEDLTLSADELTELIFAYAPLPKVGNQELEVRLQKLIRLSKCYINEIV